MRVTLCGFSGLEKAYTSVLSTAGSLRISGASRWLDAPATVGSRPTTAEAATTLPAAMHAVARLRPGPFRTELDIWNSLPPDGGVSRMGRTAFAGGGVTGREESVRKFRGATGAKPRRFGCEQGERRVRMWRAAYWCAQRTDRS